MAYRIWKFWSIDRFIEAATILRLQRRLSSGTMLVFGIALMNEQCECAVDD